MALHELAQVTSVHSGLGGPCRGTTDSQHPGGWQGCRDPQTRLSWVLTKPVFPLALVASDDWQGKQLLIHSPHVTVYLESLSHTAVRNNTS